MSIFINYPYTLPIIENIKNNYEAFRFATYELSHKGLFTDGIYLYAVIFEVENNDEKRIELLTYYEEFRTICIPAVIIVGKILPNFKKIPLRDSFEKINLFGQVLGMNEFINQLNIHIPKKYHPFHADMSWGDNEFKLTLKSEISDDDKDELQIICESLGYQGFTYVFQIDPSINEYPGVVNFEPNALDNLQLVASGLIRKQFSRGILEKYEEDEDFWLRNRNAIFCGEALGNYLPKEFVGNETKCFVDASTFKRKNIRVYLSLYEKIIIALPLRSEAQYFYEMFGITSAELQELVSRGRLLFVVPQNLARYSENLLLEILSVNPNSIIFSRHLVASTIQGIQNKTGIAGFTFSSDEQYEFLYNCAKSKNSRVELLAKFLSEQWQYSEYLIDKQGAVSVFQAGLSSLATKIFDSKWKDFTIELTSAGSSFEFAQGLQAHHFPFDEEQYSEVNACKIIGGLYGGVAENLSFIKESEIGLLLKRVLAINNDMNVLELDDALSNNNLRLIPDILNRYSNLTEDELKTALYNLKIEIMQIEKNNSNLTCLDFTGTGAAVLSGAAMESLHIPGGAYISLGAWLVKMLCNYACQSALADNLIFTRLSSLNNRVSQDAVIVKMCRDAVNKYS